MIPRRRENDNLGDMSVEEALHRGIVMRLNPELVCGSVSPDSKTLCLLEPDHDKGVPHLGFFKPSYVSWS